MSEHKSMPRGRTLLAGKVISNFGQSSIDCVVRRITDHGATISVESPLGIPRHFQLHIPDEGAPVPCTWNRPGSPRSDPRPARWPVASVFGAAGVV
jgi:hypothetical protein